MKLLVLLSFLFVVSISYGQYDEFPLYPEGLENNPISYDVEESYVDSVVAPGALSGKNRVYSYVSNPTYMLFPASEAENKHIGLVIAPGGGLRNVWLDKEGIDIALWLSQKGISCMVLKYRVNHRDEKGKFKYKSDDYKEVADQDAKQAVTLMRSMAGNMDFDPDKVGMIGFSAGGWLTERITVKKVDGIGNMKPDWMPDFAGLIYFKNEAKYLKNKKNLKDLPPIFMAVARDDYRLGVLNDLDYFTKLILDVEKSELHIYNSGGHGFGISNDKGISVATWIDSFYNWMLDVNPQTP
ncbi:MAG: hypothetical protein JW798_14500 [Prolixibacteraceae bacterium]|nr:hypothetical protein [Prolixibacteraceae bacterium]